MVLLSIRTPGLPLRTRLSRILAGVCLSAVMAWTLPAQVLPRVHIIATGGTISNLGNESRRTGEELVAAIPALKSMARVTVEQFSNVASGAVTQEMWRDLAKRIAALQAGADAPAGFVVTHGTDTMEETAFFLSDGGGNVRPLVFV